MLVNFAEESYYQIFIMFANTMSVCRSSAAEYGCDNGGNTSNSSPTKTELAINKRTFHNILLIDIT